MEIRALWSKRAETREQVNADGCLLLSEAGLVSIDVRSAGGGRTVVIPEDRRVIVHYHVVKIEGDVPKLNGWTFAAKVEPLAGEALLVHTNPNFQGEIPAAYRTTTPRCDHCQTVRRRTALFVLSNEDGRWAQVGRNCIADFLGTRALAAIEMLQWLGSFGELEADTSDWSDGGRARAYFPIQWVLASTVHVIAVEGWMSRSAAARAGAGRYQTPTAECVVEYLAGKDGKYRDGISAKVEWSEQMQAEADAALAWARELPTGETAANDYLHNLATLAGCETVEYKYFGLVCSLIPTYRRAMGREIERKRQAEISNHVGVVGKRFDLDATVVDFREREGDYGVTTWVKLMDGAGNILIWWASGRPGVHQADGNCVDLVQGRQIHCRATVKKHDSYKGVRQTVIARARLTDEIEGAVEAAPVEVAR